MFFYKFHNGTYTQQHDEALSWYKKIARIVRQYPNNRLILSRALDKVGLTASLCTNKQNLQWALIALHESLSIRHSLLGPHHCDVVDTLNNIAGVHLHQREYIQARDAYIEVLTVRSAIFGKRHPSVAVTAATLGKVYTSLSEFDNALRFMYFALRVYKEEPNSLKDSHPVVQKILRNISRTERLKRR
jgi:tetratricopeptide (TPR) repeat protein